MNPKILYRAIVALGVPCALVHHLQLIDMIRYAFAVRSRFGFSKALVIATKMRSNFMPLRIENVDALLPWKEEMKAFRGGYEYVGSKVAQKNNNNMMMMNEPKVGILFFPGALVDPLAYAPFLYRLSQEAATVQNPLLVCCVKYPFRNPVLFPYGIISKILKKRHANVRSWIFMGHSMGAGSFGAAGIVGWLTNTTSATQQENLIKQIFEKNKQTVNGLVMLAGTITGGSLDLSKGLKDFQVLVVLGSEDTITPPNGNSEAGRPVQEGIQRKLPKHSTKLVILRGANHAGFGHYGPQRFPFPDGERKVTLEKQQTLTIHHIRKLISKIIWKNKQG